MQDAKGTSKNDEKERKRGEENEREKESDRLKFSCLRPFYTFVKNVTVFQVAITRTIGDGYNATLYWQEKRGKRVREGW